VQIADAVGERGATIILFSRKDAGLSPRKVADLEQAQEHLAGLGIEADWIAETIQRTRRATRR